MIMKTIKDAEQYAKELLKPAPKKFKRRTVKNGVMRTILIYITQAVKVNMSLLSYLLEHYEE